MPGMRGEVIFIMKDIEGSVCLMLKLEHYFYISESKTVIYASSGNKKLIDVIVERLQNVILVNEARYLQFKKL